MNFEEYWAKPILAKAGIAVPKGIIATCGDEAYAAAKVIGSCVIKAQVPTGKRGKFGGIKFADNPGLAAVQAQSILGMKIDGYIVEKVLIEGKADVKAEYYAAVLNDPETKSPIVIFSPQGGIDVEEITNQEPEKLRTTIVDIRYGLSSSAAENLVVDFGLGDAETVVAENLVKLYSVYRENDAELVEVNPLIVTVTGEVIALDCKFVMDDSSIKRQIDLASKGSPDKLTRIETIGEQNGIKYIELDGDVVVLANGAGLTMTTMDVVRHYGGRPANFCEIGGEAYTKGKQALEMVLAKPNIKSLVINFCGAFARCDVMMSGLLAAWDDVRPDIPAFFSIAGTGDKEAIAMLKDRLNIKPLPNMDAACKAAAEVSGIK